MQRNWIGRSHGAQVKFDSNGHGIEVFHHASGHAVRCHLRDAGPRARLFDRLVAAEWPEGVDPGDRRGRHAGRGRPAYRASIAAKTDLERQENRRRPASSSASTP